MKAIFISWLPHCRRSDSLAAAIGGKSHLIHYFGFRMSWQAVIKYPLQAAETILRLYNSKADLLLVATPPVVAALPVYIYARIRNVPFVVDAHTGVFDDSRWTWLLLLSRWLSRAATATIVTNEHLAQIVRSWGAQAVIIGSVPMHFPAGQAPASRKSVKVVFISTFSRDEPVEEVLKAAKNMPNVHFDITGDLKRASGNLYESAPPNVHFTGWLTDEEYANLLRAATVVMVLTTRDHTMQRGAYEAMSLEKPLITSSWALLRETFSKGTVHVDNTIDGITAGIDAAVRGHDALASEMKLLRQERIREFELRLNELLGIIKNHSHFSSNSERNKETAQV